MNRDEEVALTASVIVSVSAPIAIAAALDNRDLIRRKQVRPRHANSRRSPLRVPLRTSRYTTQLPLEHPHYSRQVLQPTRCAVPILPLRMIRTLGRAAVPGDSSRAMPASDAATTSPAVAASP